MKFKKSETIVLTNAEYDLLNNASELLDNIYCKASDIHICELTDKATNMIADLFMYIEREGG